jgi:2-enoate reductase
MGRLETKKVVSCAVNPACSRENEYRLYPALKKKKIMVIGGGIAGMEAARVAAIRGHEVALYEKAGALGGHILEASVPEFKKDERVLLQWYINELKENSVDIHLNTLADENLIAQVSPDEIIVATGAVDRIPKLEGIDRSNVLTACEAFTGIEKEVVILEMMDRILDSVFISHANKMMLEDLIKFKNIPVITGACVQKINEASVEFTNAHNEKESVEMDTVVNAIGYVPEKQLYDKIRKIYPNVLLIGDASKVRNIHNAIWDGYEVGRTL